MRKLRRHILRDILKDCGFEDPPQIVARSVYCLMKITNYNDAVEYLESFIGQIRYRIDKEFLKHHDPLERTRKLLDLLGNPQNKFKSILIGGTAGKGSTAYLMSHILTTAGYKTGLTTSPHLQRINERIQLSKAQSSIRQSRIKDPACQSLALAGRQSHRSKVKSYSSTVNQLEPISDVKFIDLLNQVIPTVEQMRRVEIGAPSYFEIIIAMAFKYFADEKVDIAVVEVGMGGEYDATNTLYPLVAVITNVSLDHTNVLGGTVQKIARTKAGIIKENKDLRLKIYESKKNHKSSIINHKSIVVTGVKQPSVIKIVEDRCKEVGAEVFRLGKDFSYGIKKEDIKGTVFDFSNNLTMKQFNNVYLSLLGRHQVENASLAIETVFQLEKFGFEVSENHIRKALKTAFFPGRFENIQFQISIPDSIGDKFQIVLDSAHNPTKMKAFLLTLKRFYPKNPKIFVIAFKNDKDIKGMLKQILKVADLVIATEFHAKTDTSIKASAEALNIKYQISNIKYNGKVLVEKDSKKALRGALNLLTIQQRKVALQQRCFTQYNNSTIIIVTGSLYLVGEVRDFLL